LRAVITYIVPACQNVPVINRFDSTLFSLVLCVLTCVSMTVTTAQTAAEKKQEGKSFGYSLRKPYQDAERHTSDTQTRARKIKEESEAANETIKVETLMAVFDFLVIDRSGKPVENLGREEFIVTEDGIRQDVALFSKGNDIKNPRSIILIIEWSNTAHYVEKSLVAAQTFIDRLGPQDEMAIVTSDVKLVCDFTSDKESLKAALQVLRDKISENSRQSLPAESGLPPQQFEFETLLAVLQELVDERSRNIVIFQADGGEALYLRDQPLAHAPVPPPARRIKLADVLSAVTRSRATIYSVIPDYQYIGLPPDEQITRARQTMRDQVGYLPESQQHLFVSTPHLRNIIDSALIAESSMMRVASLSGGWASFLERPDQAAQIYSRILADTNQRYVIAYHITDKTRDGRLRSVRIQVRGHPEYLVQGRQSYSVR
jgi:VWFA-related protein